MRRWLVLICLLVALPVWAQGPPSSGLPADIPDVCGSSFTVIHSAQSGNWSSTSTWVGGVVPSTNHNAVIDAGHTVTLDLATTAALRAVCVHGTLQHPTSADSKLRVGTLMVYGDGTYTMGTTSTPIHSAKVAELAILNQALDTDNDPETYWTGFLCFGTCTMHGAIKTPWVRLSAEVSANDAVLHAASAPSGWQSGDTLVVPDTRSLPYAQTRLYGTYTSQFDTPLFASLSGTDITLQAGITHGHEGARDAYGTLQYYPHVANLTRNCRVYSEAPSGTRGHVIFTDQGNSRRARVNVQYCSFTDLGRTVVDTEPDSTTFNNDHTVAHLGTNQIGRYEVHMHHLLGPSGGVDGTYTFVFTGNVMVRGKKWGIGVHGTHYGYIGYNVAYDILGAAYMTEDGTESKNVFEYNIAFLGNGTGPRDSQTGRAGVGFFFRGPNNYVHHNIAAGMQSDSADCGYGYKYLQTYISGNNTKLTYPDAPGSSGTISVNFNTLPLLQFEDNEVYGATESGFSYWWVGTFDTILQASGTSLVKDLTVWHIFNHGIFHYQQQNMTFDHFVYRGKKAGSFADGDTAYYGADYTAVNEVFDHADVQGPTVGFFLSTQQGDDGVHPYGTMIQNSFISSYSAIVASTPWTSGYKAELLTVPRHTLVRNVTFSQYPNKPSNYTYCTICMIYDTSRTNNLQLLDVMDIQQYQGVSGHNFRVYYAQQASTVVMPQTVGNGQAPPFNGSTLLASPVSGLTNAQNWATFGIAIAGAVAPCTDTSTYSEIFGITCMQSYPSPPTSLRLMR